MSWFGSGNSAFDEQVERATGSSLEDMALNLEISDMIRSKTVAPKDAMRSLKKRVSHKNPNVQLAALNLTDTCVKNGGSHFFVEITSRDFLDNLTFLIRSQDGSVNEQVRQKIISLVQTWAIAAETISEGGYVIEIYRTLQREGFRFPPREEVVSSMYQSSAPPEWTDSDVCMRCREKFTFTNRKHHCRNCGNVFCGACSGKSIALPKLGIVEPVRVDDGCYSKLTDKAQPWPGPADTLPPKPARTLYQASMQPRDARITDSAFDADMRRALEMSLEEATGRSDTGSLSRAELRGNQPTRYTPRSSSAAPPKTSESDEEMDADLKAAIAASLRDMEEQKQRHAETFKQHVSASATPPVNTAPKKDNELTPIEAENINLFSTLVDRLQHQPAGAVLREPQIQALYESIGKLRPKLARTYGETMSKHDTLLDLHSKLGTVVRYYDKMLEDRLSSAYGARSSQPYIAHEYPAANAHPSLANGVESYYAGQQDPNASFTAPYDQYQVYQSAPPQHGAYIQSSPQQPQVQQYHVSPTPIQYNRDPSSLPSGPYNPVTGRSTSGPADIPSSPISQTPYPAPEHPGTHNIRATSGAASSNHFTSYPQTDRSMAPDPTSMESYYSQPSQAPTPAPPRTVYPQQISETSFTPNHTPVEHFKARQPQQYGQPQQLQQAQQINTYRPPPPPQQQQQQQYQQQQQQQTPQGQQQWPQAPSSHLGYGQEAFPTAPQHLPDQAAETQAVSASEPSLTQLQAAPTPKVEESLIEL